MPGERDEALAAKLARNAFGFIRTQPLKALAMYERAMDLDEHPQSFYVNALYTATAAHTKRRDPARLRRMLERVLARRRLHADTYWNAACAWIALGDADQCIECLRKAKRRGVDMKKCLRDTAFLPLANDKRFLALRLAAGLRASRAAGSRQR